MRHLWTTAVLGLLLCSSAGLEAKMANVVVTNKSDAVVEIVPLHGNGQKPMPTTLSTVTERLPLGSFLIVNKASVPVKVVVALWSFTDRSGRSYQKRYNCNGFVVLPSEPIVQASDSALVTPGGCTMREYFSHMVGGNPMVGGNLLDSELNQSVLQSEADIEKVEITVDSVIFADGKIWGPDKLHYFERVAERYWAMQSVVEELPTPNGVRQGADFKTSLDKVQVSVAGKDDKASSTKRYFVGLLQRSPDPSQTYRLIKNEKLPEFQHIGGQVK
jgi:hypothetical protein